MKKRTCMMMVVVLLLLTLTACSGKSEHGLDKDHPMTVTIWHYYNGIQKVAFDKMVSEFNETVGLEKGIYVEAINQGTVNELAEKVMNSVNNTVGSEATPNIFAAYADTAYAVDKAGMVADFSAYLTDEEKAEYVDAYLEEGNFDGSGSLKIFPVAKASEILLVNMTDWNAFAKATGASEEEFATWEGLAQMSEQYYQWTDEQTDEPGDGKAMFGRDAFANYMLIGSLQLGKELVQVTDGKPVLNMDKEVMRKLWDNYYVPYIKGGYAAIGKFRSDDAKTGDIIAMVCSTSGSSFFPTEVTREDGSSYPIEGKAFPVPNFEGTSPYAIQQGAGMVITKGTESQEYASTVFLKWFTDVEKNSQFSVDSGYLPVKKAANSTEVIEEALQQSDNAKDSIVKDTLLTTAGMLNTYQLYTTKAFDQGGSVRKALENSMSSRAQMDRETVVSRISEGMTDEEAQKEFLSDECFEDWYQELYSQLEELVGKE